MLLTLINTVESRNMDDSHLVVHIEDPNKGLTSVEAEARLAEYGRNEIPEKVRRGVNTFLMRGYIIICILTHLLIYTQITRWYIILLKQFIGPFPSMIEVACVLAGIASKWDDFSIILAMLLINGFIGLFQELKVMMSHL